MVEPGGQVGLVGGAVDQFETQSVGVVLDEPIEVRGGELDVTQLRDAGGGVTGRTGQGGCGGFGRGASAGRWCHGGSPRVDVSGSGGEPAAGDGQHSTSDVGSSVGA